MKLSFEQIKSLARGSVRTWQENGELRFSKCTESQVLAWHSLEPILGERAETTTGVRIDLHTDSSRFAFCAPRGSRFDIYINNVFKYSLTEDTLTQRKYEIPLSGNDNRVTLYLPCHDIGTLEYIELDDGANFYPHKFLRKLLFIGDSITQGWDSGYDSLSYAQRVSRFFDADSVIQGIGGGFFDESVLDTALDFEPDAVIVAFGTNDWRRAGSIDELERRASAFLDKLCRIYNDKKLIGISPIWRGDSYGESLDFDEVCNAVKKQICGHGMLLVDGFTLTPHMPEFFADYVLHPNALGFSIYSENLIRAIEDYIK